MLTADLDNDMTVNFKDFALLADSWLTIYDVNDLITMADEWLKTGSTTLTNIVPSFDKDPNNLSGYVQMSIDAPDPNIYRVFAMIGGKPLREFFIETEDEKPYVGIQTERFANGPHSIKIVSLDMYGNVICSQANEVIFNNELSSIIMSEGYEPNKPYCLYAFGSPGASYSVDVNDDFNDTAVYSGNFTGNIQAVIPTETFAADDLIYGLTVRSSSSPEEPIVCSTVSKKVEYSPNSSARMIVSIGSGDLDTEKKCAKVIKAVINAGNIKIGKDCVIPLRFGDSSWDNVKRWLQLPDVKIWVHFAHGYYGLKSLGNQTVEFNGGSVSALDSWRYSHSIEELGFKKDGPNKGKLNFVFFHSCYGAHTTQFAEALGIHPIPLDEQPGKRAFISWYDIALSKDYALFKSYNTYLIKLWEDLQDGMTLYAAKEEAADWAIPRGQEISDNLMLYGVSTDQEVWFRYPRINNQD